MEQFSATTATEFARPQVVSKAPHHAPSHPSKTPATEKNGVALAGRTAVALSEESKSERHAQQALSGVQSKLMWPVMLQLGGILTWPISKLPLPRINTVLASVFKAIPEAFTKTNFSNFTQLPANYMKEVAGHAQAVKLDGWASKATNASAKWATRGETAGNWLSKIFAGFKDSKIVQAMPGAVKRAASKIGSTNLFTGLLVAGVTAGVGASLFGARAESKEAKEAYKTLMADLGTDQGEFARAIKAEYSSKTNMNLTRAGLETVGGAINGVVMSNQHMVGFGMIAASMIPDFAAMLIPEKPLLSAYMTLKQADAGQMTLEPAQRAQIFKGLIALVPSVAQHGGEYNRLATPIANAMADKKMTAVQVVQLLNNHEAFTKFAAEVSAKQKATEAAVLKDQPKGEAKPEIKSHGVEGKHTVQAAHAAAVGAAAPVGHNQGHQASAGVTHAHATAHMPAHATTHHGAANAPSLKVGQVEHKGHLTERQRAVANG